MMNEQIHALSCILKACPPGKVRVNGLDIGAACESALAGHTPSDEVLLAIRQACPPGMYDIDDVDIGRVAASAMQDGGTQC